MKYFYVFPLFLICKFLCAQDFKKEFWFGAVHSGGAGQVSIEHPAPYDSQLGFGFDMDTFRHVQILREKKAGLLWSREPFYFSVKVPEGDYRVTLLYQGGRTPTQSTVRSESRRLHLQGLTIAPEIVVEKSFVVHVKNPVISAGRSVRLKEPREPKKLDWDDKLTLEFQGENRLRAIKIERVADVCTVFLAGNSTVTNQEEEPWASWGQMIPRFFDAEVSIANHAESGLALSSFLSSNRLDKILSVAKPGDYLFIEFGHNDQKERGDKAGAYRGYSERLRHFVEAFRAIGGTPIIVTSTARRSFDDSGRLAFSLGDYPEAARSVARELDVPLIDLNNMTRLFYEALGVDGSKNAFVHYPANTFPNQREPLQDNTHFNTYGAYQIAKMVLQGINDLHLPLVRHIIDFSGYDPAKPDPYEDWDWPKSLINSAVKPDGN